MMEINTMANNSFWEFKGRVEFVDDWFLMGTPVPILLIWMSYLLFVLKLGPEFMKKRPPYNLNNILVAYNLIQVLISTYIFSMGYRIILEHGLLPSCFMDQEDDKRHYITAGGYYYLAAKITELLDTIFFVLRKKERQITFLHVYHHSITMLASWMTLKYDPTYSAVFLATINSFVHIIMYAYYGLAAFPGMASYLWWKKYITSMQLIQFLLIIVQFGVNYAVTECPPSYAVMSTILLNVTLFLYLFSDFYVKSYVKKDSAKSNCNMIKKDYTKYSNNISKVSVTKYSNGFVNSDYKQSEKDL